MADKKIRFGIIGLGAMSKGHIEKIIGSPNGSIVAVCDVSTAALDKFGEQLGVDPAKRYDSFRAIIRDSDVDALASITPNDVHYEIIKLCIEAGKPILSEKPFTRTWEEAEHLNELYKERPIPCLVGFSYRYVPSFQYARQLLKENKLGTIRHILIRYLMESNLPMHKHPYTWRFSKAAAGSGVLADVGSHMIDAARFFVGEFKSVSALLQTFDHERIDPRTGEPVRVDVDDFASFQGMLDGGIAGNFITHKHAVGTGNQLEVDIYGDYGSINICNERPDVVKICLRDESNLHSPYETIAVPKPFRKKMYDDFFEYAAGGLPDGVPTFEDGYRNQQVLEKIMQSAETGRLMQID